MRQFWVGVYGLLALVPVAAAAAPPKTLLPAGELSTSGNQIVDRDRHPVRLACIGWNQVYETPSLEQQTALIAAHGFNCIRHAWANATKAKEIAMVDRMAV